MHLPITLLSLLIVSWSGLVRANQGTILRLPSTFVKKPWITFVRGGGTEAPTRPKTDKFVFTATQKGDGHEEDGGVPRRFVRMQKGNVAKAQKAFAETLRWRAEKNVDSILARPHPHFDIFKKVQIHYFPGRDASDHIIFVQRPGSLDFELGAVNNVDKDDLLYHYVWILEYCWNLIEPVADATMTNVLDLKGVTFSKTKSLMKFIREFVGTMSSHYPQRSFKTLVINTPTWASVAFKLISPLLRESTKKKIQFLSGGKKQDAALKEILGEACPNSLLSTADGSDPFAGIYETQLERDMRQFCLSRLKENGAAMQEVKYA